MEPEERKAFANLLLLCKKHHTMVDSKKNEKKYPVETLEEWKRRRERHLGSHIRGLSLLTEDRLVEFLEKAATSSRDEIMGAIEKVHGLSREVKDMLRAIVDEPYRRPLVDPDAVTSLEHSAGMLAFLQDHTPVLAESARAITSLADHNGVLIRFSDAISKMPDLSLNTVGNWEYLAVALGAQVDKLQLAASQVDEATAKLEAAAGKWAASADSAELPPVLEVYHPHTPSEYGHGLISGAEEGHLDDAQDKHAPDDRATRKKFFLWGMAIGAALILLIQLTGILFVK